MNCPSCGSALKIDGDREILYCPYCGAELPDDRVSINHNYNYNEEHIYKDVNVNHTKKEVDWTAIIAICALPAFVIILLLILAIAGEL